MKKSIISMLALSLAIASCNKDKSTSSSGEFGSVTNIHDLKVPSTFNWSSSKALMTDISIVGIEGMPKKNVRVDIYDVDPYQGGKVLHSGFTNNQGKLEVPVKLPTSIKEVVVVASTVGIGGNRITASVSGNTIKAHFSGVPMARKFDKHSSAGTTPTRVNNVGPSGLDVFYLGNFNSDGVPSGMSSIPVTQAYLDDLELTLPENNHLPCDPVRKSFLDDLFCNQVTTSKDDAEVYVTYLAEGAGFLNSLAYYYYPAGNPPASRADIDSIFVIFPNATESATGMQAGDRVKIGTFPKNTTIEWVLLGDMWNPAIDSVEYGHRSSATFFYFGEDGFNSDMGVNKAGCSDANFNRHMISLTDNFNGEEIQIFAFEDIHYPYGDYDFNDCIFYASGDLYQSCAPTKADPNVIVNTNDTDGDGIIDPFDDEPNDADVACLVTYEGTLVFEDLWPAKGDYDFNDLVTAYDITHAIHAQGYIHEVRADYTLKAAGAGYNNGFGTVFSDDVAKADIASITGRTSTGNFPMDGDLTASGPGAAIMYNWDAGKDIYVNDINGGAFFNTVVGGGKGNVVTENIVITMNNNAVQPWELGLPPYNTFIFANQDQTREIHLADMEPSGLNDASRFGTADDDSDPLANRYYKTVPATNLPWALDIPKLNFEWPVEKVDILTAYPQFGAWASSGGAINTSWYDNPDPTKVY